MMSRLHISLVLSVIVTAFSPWAQAQGAPRLAYAPADAAQLPAPAGTVARVALAVGEARRVDAAGRAHPLHGGATVQAGDRVVTGPDAMVMLVFVDEGRISLRADSELLVRHYEIDPSGARTRIELELLRGTVRQISGNAARAQPDRYRLNTPIAVIGVRGTDFLAKTADTAVEAFVHEGQIVLTPRDAACAGRACEAVALVSSSGPALRYVRLNAAGQVEHREFRPGELERIFGVDLARPVRPSPAAAVASASPAEPMAPAAPAAARGGEFQLPVGSRLITDTIFVAARAEGERVPEWVNAAPAAPRLEPVAPEAPVPPMVAAEPPALAAPVAASAPVTAPVAAAPVTAPVAAAPVAAAPVEAVVAVAPPVPLPRQLVWGRFSNAAVLPQVLPVSYDQAREGRHVTVGELGQYALWREGVNGRLDRALKGQADFRLAASEALFAQPSGVTPAEVTAATLRVDFDRSTFAAGVGVRHAVAGAAALSVSGRVDNEGVFVGANATDRIAGALTRDGAEAGYLFSKTVNGGTFRGITLWGRP